MIWTGIAVLIVKDGHPSREEGYLGAYAAVACEAASLSEAVRGLQLEFEDQGLALVGVENLLPTHMRDRRLTKEEEQLVEALDSYPVQFRDVHFHKGDG
jgi:hypothetical protein